MRVTHRISYIHPFTETGPANKKPISKRELIKRLATIKANLGKLK